MFVVLAVDPGFRARADNENRRGSRTERYVIAKGVSGSFGGPQLAIPDENHSSNRCLGWPLHRLRPGRQNRRRLPSVTSFLASFSMKSLPDRPRSLARYRSLRFGEKGNRPRNTAFAWRVCCTGKIVTPPVVADASMSVSEDSPCRRGRLASI